MENESSPEPKDDCCNMWRIESCASLAYALSFKEEDLKLITPKLEKKETTAVVTPTSRPLNITDLPPELLEQIFLKLNFDSVAKIRGVCQYFNTVASNLLNSEFSRLRTNMHQRFQAIKGQMPRRESARRKHPLARESDIIETLHMRLTLLHMAFGKHIERKHCCFFAGEILDEVYRILHYVKTTPNLNRAYKVTDELFDLSTMAMEYFKEHIEPSLPEITYFTTDFLEYTPTITSSPKTQVSLLEEPGLCTSSSSSRLSSVESSASRSTVSPAVTKRLRKLRENMKRSNNQVIAIKQQLKLARKKLILQQKQIHELKSRHEDYDRKFQNTSRKISAVLQELNRCKTELQYWRSKSPAAQCSCGKITPVFDVRDSDHVIGSDNRSEKMSPKPQDELLEDFKPISPEVEPLPSCSSIYVNVSSSHCTPTDNKTVLTVSHKAVKKTPEKSRFSNSSMSRFMSAAKSCKRKLEVEEFQGQSKRLLLTLSDIESYHKLYGTSSGEEESGDNLSEGQVGADEHAHREIRYVPDGMNILETSTSSLSDG